MVRPDVFRYIDIDAGIKNINSENPALVEAARFGIGGLICMSILEQTGQTPAGKKLSDTEFGGYVGRASRLNGLESTPVAQIFVEEALKLRQAFGARLSTEQWRYAILQAGGGYVNNDSVPWLNAFANMTFDTNPNNSRDRIIISLLINLVSTPLDKAKKIPSTVSQDDPVKFALDILQISGLSKFVKP